MTILKVYIDESGNTTREDEDQRILFFMPYHDDELKKLQKDINYSKELHFSEMKAQLQVVSALNLLFA